MKRITALLLVCVMLALTLVSCGYSYAKDDMSAYATFDKASFDEAIMKLTIADGDFTADEETRKQKVIDYIYEILVGKVDSDKKVTKGVVGAHDKFAYCYYATAEDSDGNEFVVFASTMNTSSAKTLQFGLTDTKGFEKLVEEKFTGVDIESLAYTTENSGTAVEGQVAYISYTLEETISADATKKTTYTNERVTIGDWAHPFARFLPGKAINTTLDNHEDTENGKTYSGIKINWVVKTGAETIIEDTTYTESNEVTDVTGEKRQLKDVKLTYHVYPVYFLEVEEINATTVLKTLITDYVTEIEATDEEEAKTEYALPSLEANAELAKALDAAKDALTAAEKELSDAETAVSDAEKALEDAKKLVAEGATPTEEQQASIDKAQTALDAAKPIRDEKATAKANAETAYTAKIAEVIGVIGEDKIVEEYKSDIYDALLDEYNNEIKMNLASAIWTLIKEKAVVNEESIPEDAIKATYDRMIEQYEYQFYAGSDSSSSSSDGTTTDSNYKKHNGNFKEFLMVKAGNKSTYKEAQDTVWVEAKAYVIPIIQLYRVAEAYELKLTNKEYKDALKDIDNNSYSAYENTQGEENVKAAVQFDKIMEYLLESTTAEDTGAVTYTRVAYEFKK